MRILLVEEDGNNRRFMSSVLMQRGYEVIQVQDVDVAAVRFRSKKCDIVICDILKRKATEFITSIKQNPVTQNVPIIVCSEIKEEGIIPKIEAFNVTAIIRKPIDKNILLEKVAEIENKLIAIAAHKKTETAFMQNPFSQERHDLNTVENTSCEAPPIDKTEFPTENSEEPATAINAETDTNPELVQNISAEELDIDKLLEDFEKADLPEPDTNFESVNLTVVETEINVPAETTELSTLEELKRASDDIKKLGAVIEKDYYGPFQSFLADLNSLADQINSQALREIIWEAEEKLPEEISSVWKKYLFRLNAEIINQLESIPAEASTNAE